MIQQRVPSDEGGVLSSKGFHHVMVGYGSAKCCRVVEVHRFPLALDTFSWLFKPEIDRHRVHLYAYHVFRYIYDTLKPSQ